MTVRYSFDGKQNELAFDDVNRIFTAEYQNFELTKANSNLFEKQVKNKIDQVVDIAKNEKSMQNLSSGISNLFDKDENNERDILSAISLWNANAKIKTTGSSDIKSEYRSIINTDENKEKIYTYFEFMQFKRARFECKNVEYNQNTGRIIEMTFQFTGKFN